MFVGFLVVDMCANKCTQADEVEYKVETSSGGGERRRNEACVYMYERRSHRGAVHKAPVSATEHKVKASVVG